MRTIAVLNQKGGVGKTSSTVNLSAALAAAGKRVCVFDMDPQAHATLHLGVSPVPGELSIYNVLTGTASLSDVRRQVGENLWVVGSDIDLAAAEVELAGMVGRELILRDQMEMDGMLSPQSNGPASDGSAFNGSANDGQGSEEDAFDYVVIDCPPSLGVLTINALACCDEVLIPLQPHFLALHGLSKLLETIQLVSKRLNPKIILGGILLCLYEAGTKLANEITQDVIDFLEASRRQNTPWADARVFQARIRRNIRIAEAPSFGQHILDYAPTSNGAVDYLALSQELLDRDQQAKFAAEQATLPEADTAADQSEPPPPPTVEAPQDSPEDSVASDSSSPEFPGADLPETQPSQSPAAESQAPEPVAAEAAAGELPGSAQDDGEASLSAEELGENPDREDHKTDTACANQEEDSCATQQQLQPCTAGSGEEETHQPSNGLEHHAINQEIGEAGETRRIDSPHSEPPARAGGLLFKRIFTRE